MPDFRPSAEVHSLYLRASTIRQIREFFFQRNVVEVETPIISNASSIDQHIDPILLHSKSKQFSLITSPEYHMKRLLAAGMKDIFQICKSFREGDRGTLHNPEFTILEWYRLGFDQHRLMDEVGELVSEILSTPKIIRLSYQDIFKKYASIDPFTTISKDQFSNICSVNQLSPPSHFDEDNQDELLNYLMAFLIEPQLGLECPTFIYNYPKSQASLAKLNEDKLTAARFELYYKGIELCNGFHELTNYEEQKIRLDEENQMREKIGKKPLTIDQRFLNSLQNGLPECSGVALGIDRIIMLQQGFDSIDSVLSFHWENS